MRPLHRPMFRYGGPIKEGVMSGIREPHAGGGRAALVGNPVYPRTGGREHHNIVKNAPKFIKPGYWGSFVKPGTVGGKIKSWFTNPGQYTGTPTTKQKIFRFFDNTPAGKYLAGTTEGKLVKKVWDGKSWVTKPIKATIEGVSKSPTGIGIGAYMLDAFPGGQPLLNLDMLGNRNILGQKYDPKTDKRIKGTGISGLWEDEEDKKEDEKKLTPDQLRIKQLEKLIASQKEPQVPQKSDAEIRQEQIQKYRDIMDIKGMNKEAAYDSLIAASQAINESGDFKGDLRSGKLINQIIQGASKAFDKPKKTKDAIDTLILKGEIEKDLNKDKNAIMDAYRMKQIELADKQLNESLTEKAIKFAGTMKKPYVDQETAIMTIRDQFDVTPNIVLSEKDMEEVKKQDDYKNETDVFTKIVEKQTLGPGYYVMGSSGFVVDEGGNIKQIL